MSLLKTHTRNRSVPGSLGPLGKSVGYLQGGYKGAAIFSKIQYFNTNTNSGSLVYDTGFNRKYRPGINGRFKGYFSIDDATNFNSFNFVTYSQASSFNITKSPTVTCSDSTLESQSWMISSDTAGWNDNSVGSNWLKLNLTLDTLTSHGTLSSGPTGTTRQAASTTTHGFFCQISSSSPGIVYALKFSTQTVSNQGSSDLLNNSIQYACGMSCSESRVYMVGFIDRTVQMNFSGASITSIRLAQSTFTYNFGESHSLSSSTTGYMMAGYQDTTARYGGQQHGLCQSINFSNEAITTQADLVLPQSSGQMMQGF